VSAKPPYVLDSDVFITAKNRYYAFAICPGFWDCLIHHFVAGNVYSIDRVRGELLAGRKTDDLVQWVMNTLPSIFFVDTNDAQVSSAYAKVMLWVNRNTQYYDHAKAEFAAGADGWLVAYSMVHGNTIVTNEQSQQNARSRVPLPNVCAEFDVICTDTFEMLRDLSVRLEWRPS